jgi:hypothetical protein
MRKAKHTEEPRFLGRAMNCKPRNRSGAHKGQLPTAFPDEAKTGANS